MMMCDHGPMSQKAPEMTELVAAATAYKRVLRRQETAHTRLVAAMRAARDAGVRQVTLVELTGYTREHVRRLLKD